MANYKIAVNTRLLIPNKLEGIGRFTHEIMLRLVEKHPEVDFVFYFDRTVPKLPRFSNLEAKKIGPPARRTFLFDWWFNNSVRRQLKKDKVDLFLSPDGFLSLTTELPQIAVMHDLNFEHYPELLPPKIAAYYRDRFPKFAQKAERIATVSNYSKQDIVHTYGIAEDKIDIVYNGVSDEFQPSSSSTHKATKKKYTNGLDYFVYVGSIHPRKNIQRLLEAFGEYKKKGGQNKFVLVGESMWKNDELASTLQLHSIQQEVVFTGRLGQSELNNVLSSAFAMCFVPLFEGFGIPIIESFQCEVPVITSNVTSLPEVSGYGALLVDPLSIDEIAFAMAELESNTSLRQELITKGKKQLEKFSWDQSADDLWECIQKTRGLC